MAAPQKISTRQIEAALSTWRGNIAAAAKALGVRRASLYERLDREGIDLATYRVDVPAPAQQAPVVLAVASPLEALDGRRSKPPVIRIRPDLAERLSEAKYELQHVLRRDIDESQIANAILDEQLEGWLAATLAKLQR